MDRNPLVAGSLITLGGSLSARRAWIEMANFCRNRFCPVVALRKESVDRNAGVPTHCKAVSVSLSARRAWIEIDIPPNLDADHARRSPQGERG